MLLLLSISVSGRPRPREHSRRKAATLWTASQKLQCKVFLSPLRCCRVWTSYSAKFLLTLCFGCSRRFRFRCIYPSLYNQPVQVRSYSVRFLLSPLRCCWCWPSPTNLKLNSPQSDSDWGELQLKICLAGSTLSWGLRLSVNFLVQVRQCTTVGSPEALSHYLVISQWTL